MADYQTGQVYRQGDFLQDFTPEESGANYKGPKKVTLGAEDLALQDKVRNLIANNDRGALYSLVGVNTTTLNPDYVDQNGNQLYTFNASGNIQGSGPTYNRTRLVSGQDASLEHQQTLAQVQQAKSNQPLPSTPPVTTPPTAVPQPGQPPAGTPAPAQAPALVLLLHHKHLHQLKDNHKHQL